MATIVRGAHPSAIGIVRDGRAAYFNNPQPYPLSADTADFRDYGDRTLLGFAGVFSVDRRRAAA